MEFYENKVKGIAPMQKKKKKKRNTPFLCLAQQVNPQGLCNKYKTFYSKALSYKYGIWKKMGQYLTLKIGTMNDIFLGQ